MRPASIPLVLALLLPGGCCSMARLFCGPDRSPWISIDYATPEAAVRTFLEALRRDEPTVVYQAISRAFREHLELDQATLLLAWPQVKAKNPYLHVAGYAEVPPAARNGDFAQLELSIEGRRLRVEVLRQKKWEVRYPIASGAVLTPGRHVTTFAGNATIDENELGTKATLRIVPIEFGKGVDDAVPLEEVQFAGLVAEWKVNKVTLLTDG